MSGCLLGLLLLFDLLFVVPYYEQKQKQLTAWSMALSDILTGGPAADRAFSFGTGSQLSCDLGSKGTILPNNNELRSAVNEELDYLEARVNKIKNE